MNTSKAVGTEIYQDNSKRSPRRGTGEGGGWGWAALSAGSLTCIGVTICAAAKEVAPVRAEFPCRSGLAI